MHEQEWPFHLLGHVRPAPCHRQDSALGETRRAQHGCESCTAPEVLARLREDLSFAEIPIVLFSELGNFLNPELITGLRVAAVVPKPAGARHVISLAYSSVYRCF